MNINSNTIADTKLNMQRMLLRNQSLTCYGVLEETSDKLVSVLLKHDKKTVVSYNPLFSMIKANDIILNPQFIEPLTHDFNMDLHGNILYRDSKYKINTCEINIKSERFLLEDESIIIMKYQFSSSESINLDFYSGVNENIESSILNTIKVQSTLHEISLETDQPNHNIVIVYEKDFRHQNRNLEKDPIEHYEIKTEADRVYSIIKYIGLSKDIDQLKRKLYGIKNQGYEMVKSKHLEYNHRQINKYRINIINNENLQILSDFSIRQLLNHSGNIDEVSPSGLGQWLPYYFYIMKEPKKAKALLEKQINALPEFILLTGQLGYKGALFSLDINKKPLGQYHILNGAFFTHMLHLYLEQTDDVSIFYSGAMDTVAAICDFYLDYSRYDENHHHYSIMNVSDLAASIHHIDNHTLTNHMVKHTIRLYKLFLNKVKKLNKAYYNDFIKKYHVTKKLIALDHLYQKIFLMKANIHEELLPYQKFNDDFKHDRLALLNQHVSLVQDQILLFVIFKDKFNQTIMKSNYDSIKDKYQNQAINQLYSSLLPMDHTIEDALEIVLENLSIEKESLFVNQENFDVGLAGFIYYFIVFRLCKLNHVKNQFTVDAILPKSVRRIELDFLFKTYLAQVKIKRNSARIEWNQ